MAIITEGLTPSFIFLVAFTVVLLYLMNQARQGRKVEMKHLPGLDAIEETVGRATEMGRPIVANPGLGGLRTGPVTIAGLSTVAFVAKFAARNGARLIVPVANPEILPVVDEIVRDAYVTENAMDEYDPDYTIRWLGDSQWSWAAALQGIAEREKVAANIMIGDFAAEAMILAETFARVGAMQVGGLTNTYQIPFFVAACDYTLVGDEMLAAGAYLSGDPQQMATIETEDIFKMVVVGLMGLGVILSLLGVDVLTNLLGG